MTNSISTAIGPEQARTLFDHLLPSIVQSRALTRELIRNVPDSKLDFLPVAGGETLSDLMWYLASAYDVFLNALCDAKFPDLPAKPQPASVQAFLDWDDSRFEQTLEKAKALSNEDLIRPLSFGPFTQPAVEFMTVFLGNVASHTGQLMAWLALALQSTNANDSAEVAKQRADGELNDDELAGVAGGQNPLLQVTPTYVTNDPYQQQQMTQILQHYNRPTGQTGLLTLFGNGQNNQIGLAAVIPGMALGVGAAAWGQWLMFGTLAFMRI